MATTQSLKQYQMFINGQWLDAQDGSRFDSLNPANAQPWASFPHAQEADVDAAVQAAQNSLACLLQLFEFFQCHQHFARL